MVYLGMGVSKAEGSPQTTQCCNAGHHYAIPDTHQCHTALIKTRKKLPQYVHRLVVQNRRPENICLSPRQAF